ncbi:hypothetical protein [Arthrobacter sp. NPDC090010]|uniref:hypothetical protein n=1 Tax=Arthrobacter sp. NPDC090010 TaxID=3363942 RepID=UPI0037FFA870
MSGEPSGAAAAVLELITARALWLIRQDAAPLAIAAAARALAAGLDGEALRELAGVPRTIGTFELGDLIEASLTSLGVPASLMTEEDSLVLGANHYARQVIGGRLATREFTAWAHSVIGHGGPEIAQEIVELDDHLDGLEVGWGESPDPLHVIEGFLDVSNSVVQKWLRFWNR